MPTEFPPKFRQLIALQHGVIARHQALASGLDADAVESWVRSGQWRRLQRGVYATFTGEPAREALLWAALLRSGPDAVLSHETAADLAGLIGPEDLYGPAGSFSAPIHVTVPTGRLPGRGRDIPGVVVHHSVRVRQARHPSAVPPRTRVEETVIDLTQTARTLGEAVAWLDRATRGQLTTAERLGTVLGARPKVRWRAQITKALGGLSPGPAASEPARPPPIGHRGPAAVGWSSPRSGPGRPARPAGRGGVSRPSRTRRRRLPGQPDAEAASPGPAGHGGRVSQPSRTRRRQAVKRASPGQPPALRDAHALPGPGDTARARPYCPGQAILPGPGHSARARP